MFLITGGNGQLGSEFQKVLTKQRRKFLVFPKDKLDITDFKETEQIIKETKPDVLINCAAYTLVDEAEEDPASSDLVNGSAVANLAYLCKKFNIFLIHFSTDYVFDGKKKDFYTEADLPNPLNKYGRSKLEGEESVIKTLRHFLIFRVSWVIGQGERNFLYKLSRWSKEKHVLEVSYDEISTPTYTQDIAEAALLSLKRRLKGLYHLANSGYCSRYELAKYFLKKMALDNILIPVPAAKFNTPAKRPFFSAMSNAKLSKELGISISCWETAVGRFIKRFKKALI